MFAAKNELFTRPSGGGYQISRSLRFNAADSNTLTRTPATAGSYYYLQSGVGNEYMGREIIVYADKLENVDTYDAVADNNEIETIADNILDFSESNPFGEDNF